MTYEKLSGASGIQWPCNDQHPDGAERLYVEGQFNAASSYCETFGHDLTTGAVRSPEEYCGSDPDGKALLFAVEYQAPHETPDDTYPFWLTTGGVLYQFHTRTKTARTPELNAAAPDAYVQIHEADAEGLNVVEGDSVVVETRRGRMTLPAKVGGIIRGHLFVPFHCGYWDEPGHARAANEVTLPEWDPVSKQPYFKYAAAKMEEAHPASIINQVADAAESAGAQLKQVAAGAKEIPATLKKALMSAEGKRPLSVYVGLLHQSELHLAEAFSNVAAHHRESPDIFGTCTLMAGWSTQQAEALRPMIARYGEESQPVTPSPIRRPAQRGIGLLRVCTICGWRLQRCISVTKRSARRGGRYTTKSWWRSAISRGRKPTGSWPGCGRASIRPLRRR